MIGRPSEYTPEMAATICARLAEGEPLTRMCKEPDMPNVVTVYRWMAKHEEFCKLYARAREDQADTMADQIIDIADETGDPHDKRVRVDARKWIAAKLKPKRYGDKQIHTGPDGESAPVLHVTATDVRG
jgi:hypothetical protein